MQNRIAAVLILTLIKVSCRKVTADNASRNDMPLTIYLDAGEDVANCLELLSLNEAKQRKIEETLQRQDKEITNLKETEKQLNIKFLELSEKLHELEHGKSTQSVQNTNESLEKRLLAIENKLKSIDGIVSEQNPPEGATGVSQLPQRPAERACEKARREIQQIQPNATARGEFSYLAKIGKQGLYRRFKLTCIGVLIDKRFVLATAHCLEYTAERLTVQLGFISGNILNAWDYTLVRDILKIHIHPQYDNGYRINIGIIELDSDVNYNPLVYPICLYTSIDKPATGIEIPILKRNGELNWSNIEIVKSSECFQKYGDFVFCVRISTTQAFLNCASIKAPLIWTKNESLKEYRLIGLPASYSNVCDQSFEATNITTILNFIESIVWAS